MSETTLKARRLEGGKYTPDDKLEIKLDYEGPLHYCVHYLEVISGGEVTHGGGASSTTPLHYKAVERDADGDGNIDYSTVEMTLVQTQRGRNDVKVCCDLVTKTDHDAFVAKTAEWISKNAVQTEFRAHDYSAFKDTEYYEDAVSGKMSFVHEDGKSYLINEGLTTDDMPQAPKFTTYKTGEITLEWHEDKFV